MNNNQHLPMLNFLAPIPADPGTRWSRVVASLLTQQSILLQKLVSATLIDQQHLQTGPLPGPSQLCDPRGVVNNRDVDRRKWRNRRNRHRKKLRRLFYTARKDEQIAPLQVQVQRTLQSVISVRETHSVAEAQLEKNERIKRAFGISDHFVEGSSLDPDRKNKEEQSRLKEEQTKLKEEQARMKEEHARMKEQEREERRPRKHGWVSTPSPSPPPKRKERKEKKKKKKRTRDRSSSPESSKRHSKSKKSKRSRSQSPKKKKRSREKKKKSKIKKSWKHSSPSSSSSSSADDDKRHPSKKKQKLNSKREFVGSNKVKKNFKKSSSAVLTGDADDSRQSINNEKKWSDNEFVINDNSNTPTMNKETLTPPPEKLATPPPPGKAGERKQQASPPSIDKWRDSFNSIKKAQLAESSSFNSINKPQVAEPSFEPLKVSSFRVDLMKNNSVSNSLMEGSIKNAKSDNRMMNFTKSHGGNFENTVIISDNSPSQEQVKKFPEKKSRSATKKTSHSHWSDASSRSSSRSTSRSWSRSSMSISPITKSSSPRSPRSNKSRSSSRSRTNWSPSRFRSASRSSFRSSCSRDGSYYSSCSSSSSRRSSRRRKVLSSCGKYSDSSRSSRSSRSSSKSRSPSIPRRKGSPSFLDKRRITSARKRPVPYHRQTPPPSPQSSSSDSSYWWSPSRSRSWSRSPS